MRFVEHRDILISDINIGNRLRNLDLEWAEALAGLIKTVGLQHPIEVYALDDGLYALNAGHHRLAAFEFLKRKVIPARLVEPETDKPELESRLHEAIENIGRRKLTALDRAAHFAELKRVYEALYPETKRGGKRGNQHTGGKKRQTDILSFSQTIAEKCGLSDKSIRRSVAIYTGLTPEARDLIRSHKLSDNNAQLGKLSKLTPNLQLQVAEAIVSGDADDVHGTLNGGVKAVQNRYDALLKAWTNASKKDLRLVFEAKWTEADALHSEIIKGRAS